MTKKECDQLYYINKEIKMWEKELEKIKNKSYINSQKITGMPFVQGTSDKTAERAMLEVAYEKIVNNIKTVASLKKMDIMNFIQSIESSSDRQIVFLRAASCLPWSIVADELGGDNTEDSVRMKYLRLFEKKL